jgi:hypothetical protein
MSRLVAVFAPIAVLMTGGSIPLSGEVAQPLALDVARDGAQAVLTIVGQSSVEVTLTYDLKVEGASRVHQSGRVTLLPDRRSTPVRVALNPATGWTAVLTVTGPDGHYTRTLDAAS